MKIKMGDWQTSNTVRLEKLGDATYTTVQQMQDVYHSAGSVNGSGLIIDNGDGTYNVASGQGYIRPTDSSIDTLLAFDWESAGPFTPVATITYVGVEYNSGSPQVVQRDTRNWNLQTEFPLGQVVVDAGELHIFNAPQGVGDHAGKMIEAMKDVMGVARDSYNGGVIISESADNNRYILLTAGSFWFGLNEFPINAVNTGVSDTFEGYYRDGSGGWSENTGLTQWNNTQYDNGSGTLQTIGAAKYGVNWFYIDIEAGGELVMLYPRAEYLTLALAQAALPPSSVPPRIQSHGKLVGRLIFQYNATTAIQTDSAFTQQFQISSGGSGTTTHNDLSGLQGGTAGEYYHLTQARHTDLTDGGDSTLHYHATDRARANHTGTQTASTISDFDTEVSNNTDVSANTSARHDALTIGTNTASALSLSGQQLSLGDVFVQLAGDTMTGDLTMSGSKLSFTGSSLGDNKIIEVTSARFQPSGPLFPINFVPVFEPTADVSNLYGSVNALSLEESSYNVTNAIGSQYQVKVQTGYTGTLTNAIGLQIINPNKIEAGAVVSNVVGLNILNQTTGSVSNRGIQSAVSSGSGKHNLYISGTADNYFAGNVGIGNTSPSFPLDILDERTATTSNQLAGFRQVWSPSTTSGAQFPTVFQLLPEYNSSHSPSSGFLTGFRSFAYNRSTGMLPIRNVDLYCANLGSATLDNARDIVVRGVGNTGGGTITLYEGIVIQSSTAATTNRGFVQQGTGMINYMQGSLSIGSNTTARTAFSVADHITPLTDNTYDLGTSTYRWDDVYATNATIQTSDINLKEDVVDSPLGLDFINALRPVKYKWKDYTTYEEQEELLGYDEDSEPIYTTVIVETQHTHTREHYGLIAQEVKAELDKLGIDFAGYIENEQGKGLRYNEFIGILIKAVQELSARVEALEG